MHAVDGWALLNVLLQQRLRYCQDSKYSWQEVELKKGRFAHMQTGNVFPAWILMCWPCRQHQIVFSAQWLKDLLKCKPSAQNDCIYTVIQSMHFHQYGEGLSVWDPKGFNLCWNNTTMPLQWSTMTTTGTVALKWCVHGGKPKLV